MGGENSLEGSINSIFRNLWLLTPNNCFFLLFMQAHCVTGMMYMYEWYTFKLHVYCSNLYLFKTFLWDWDRKYCFHSDLQNNFWEWVWSLWPVKGVIFVDRLQKCFSFLTKLPCCSDKTKVYSCSWIWHVLKVDIYSSAKSLFGIGFVWFQCARFGQPLSSV